MKCPYCGASIYDDVNRCQYCGSYMDAAAQAKSAPAQPVVVNVYQQAPESQPARPQVVYQSGPRVVYHTNVSGKSRGVALLLCVSLGWFGIHKFYLGKVGLGLLYFFTFGLMGFGVLVDVLRLLPGSPRDGYGLPLRWGGR